MSGEVWYRKWRPQTFADVCGQGQVTMTLARAVQLDRVAHAYLLCGPRGTGKTSTARILAKAVNCETNDRGQPCDVCASCRSFAEGRALDLIEMDAASNRGIDEIRGLRDRVGYSPNESRFKVYLIDEVHELTQFAFDALLKTLEEPPPHVIFVLATTEPHKVPDTIRSRCQTFDFARIKLADVVARLRHIATNEKVVANDAVLTAIGRRATGSLRDAVNLLEQLVATHGPQLTEVAIGSLSGSGDDRAIELLAHVLAGELSAALELVAGVRDDGGDPRQFCRDTVQALRSALLVRAGAGSTLDLGEQALQRLRTIADMASVAVLLRVAKLFSTADFRTDPQSTLPLELAIVEATLPPAGAGTQFEPVAVAEARNATPAKPRPPAPESVQGQQPSSRDRLQATIARGTAARPPIAPPADSAAATRPVSALISPHPNGSMPEAPKQPPATAQPELQSVPLAAEPASAASPEPLVSPAPDAITSGNGDGEVESVAVPSLEAARRRFRAIYERCREIDGGAARLLNSGGCDIVEVGDGRLVLGFQWPRMVEMAQRAGYDAAIRRSVGEVLGASFTITAVHRPEVESRLRLLDAEHPSHLLDEALKLGAVPVGRASGTATPTPR